MARKLLLDKVDIPGIRTFDVYRREGGYKSVEKAIKEIPREREVIELFKKLVGAGALPPR